jgi:hypothetical protein
VNNADFEELPEQEPSWLRLERATACRQRLLAAGYRPLPVNGKVPAIDGWTDIEPTAAIIATWESRYADAFSTGILTETTPAIDIDIMHAEAAAAVEALAREHFGERGDYILIRFGMAPKRAILLRTDEPFKKLIRKFTAPGGDEQRIEVLATGNQIVAFGLHKDTGKPYRWHGGEPGAIKRDDLPYVRRDDAKAFLDAAADLLIKDFDFKLVVNKQQAKTDSSEESKPNNGTAGIREKAWAEAALEGATAELTATKSGGRNEALNKIAFRLGGMVARGWLNRTDVEKALLDAMHANGGVEDDGLAAAEATLKSGLDDGEQNPHPDLPDDDKFQAAAEQPAPQFPPCTIEQTLEVFERWLILPNRMPVYAVLGTVAANLLPGDPIWLGVIGPPSSAKTEILNSISLLPHVVQAATLTPAGLLSGTPKKQYDKAARGGLLRQIGSFGIIALKDFGSILSMRPDAKAEVLAALREVYDGSWTRHLGTDGGRTLTWSGKVALLFAATSVIDSHYGVIGAMGDRFLLCRLGPVTHGQFSQALKHMGAATAQMRKELAEAVAGLFAGRRPQPQSISEAEIGRIDRTIMLVVRLRGAVERDRSSREIEAVYGAEGTARIGLTLERLLAGLDTLGIDRAAAFDVVERVAMDSVPPIRRRAYEYLQSTTGDFAETSAVATAIELPTMTARRALEDLAAYQLVERISQGQGKPDIWKIKRDEL